MALDQLRNCNFGRNRSNATGSTGVGYTIYDVSGSIASPRTVSGVYQLTSGSGLYAAYVNFPNNFRGQIVWDTGTAFPTASYAIEQYNVEENNPKIDDTLRVVTQMSGTISQLYNVSYGRWKIVSNQMIFYQDDNVTEIMRFNLLDDAGSPTMDSVFERVKV
jgi:hypothetical protein